MHVLVYHYDNSSSANYRAIRTDLDSAITVSNPFRKRGKTAQSFIEIMKNRRSTVSEKTWKACCNQIARIFEDEEGFVDGGFTASVSSFIMFLSFLWEIKPSQHPALSIDRDGNFVATWTKKQSALISITFRYASPSTWILVDRERKFRSAGEFGRSEMTELPREFWDWGLL
jgi:hypothetical protein